MFTDGAIKRIDVPAELNRQMRLLQAQGKYDGLPPMTGVDFERLIASGKVLGKSLYPPGEIIPLLTRLWSEMHPQPAKRASPQWRRWAEGNTKRIVEKEDLLWSRKRYQRNLDELSEKWQIPKEGFSSDEEEQSFTSRLSENVHMRESFYADLKGIVESHSSCRLPLSQEWMFVVERHLLSGAKGRIAARLAAAMNAPPQIRIDWDKLGNPIRVYFTVESDMPEVVIREYKKELKGLEKELGMKPKRRGKVSHRRDRAKMLSEKPEEKILLDSDKKLRHRYKDRVEG